MFAGVWLVADRTGRRIEVGPVPEAIATRAHEAVLAPVSEVSCRPVPMRLVNAWAIAAELFERSRIYRPGDSPHVLNLSRLPYTQGGLEYLEACFGRGAATVLSRGNGTLRAEATAVPNLWRVRHFNSVDFDIQDAFEVSDVPEVVRATPEDLRNSAERIDEVLQVLS